MLGREEFLRGGRLLRYAWEQQLVFMVRRLKLDSVRPPSRQLFAARLDESATKYSLFTARDFDCSRITPSLRRIQQRFAILENQLE